MRSGWTGWLLSSWAMASILSSFATGVHQLGRHQLGDAALDPSRRWALRGNESVGGGGHPSGMSERKTGGTDTRPAWGFWFLMKGPLADVDPQAHLR